MVGHTHRSTTIPLAGISGPQLINMIPRLDAGKVHTITNKFGNRGSV